MYRETLLTSMGMFGDKKGTLWWHAFKWPLICEAFNEHFGNKQTHCKLERNTLVISRHMPLLKILGFFSYVVVILVAGTFTSEHLWIHCHHQSHHPSWANFLSGWPVSSLDDLHNYSHWPASSLDNLHNFSHWLASSLDDLRNYLHRPVPLWMICTTTHVGQLPLWKIFATKLINVSSLVCKLQICFGSDTQPLFLKFTVHFNLLRETLVTVKQVESFEEYHDLIQTTLELHRIVS